ncbi:MAG: hypothetical protein ACQCXQ_12430 [Verrucomicrobiales bacterium]|nr:hypothetical protein [Verrucomicrobiota bacterium JB025]
MNRLICLISIAFTVVAGAQNALKTELEASYNGWRNSILRKDYASWKKWTAGHRQMEVRNRIVSEKQSFPAAVFALPTPPPSLDGLTFLNAKQKGATAKAAYFGKIDFGVGGNPTDNLLVFSFIQGRGQWQYDRADFVNLSALPEVRKELAAGNLRYLEETPEAQPSGVVPSTPSAAQPAPYIAKVYVFCPGREVRVHVNKLSRHRFANTKEAEIVIGGAKDGQNEVQFSARSLEGSSGKEAMTVRIYLMSQVAGVKPIKIYEYLAKEGEAVKPYATEYFTVDAAVAAKLAGK